jgi:hypothetical protein
MLRIPHCLDNRLIDGRKVVSPTHRPHFTPQKHYFFCFWYAFLLEAEWTPGPSAPSFSDESYITRSLYAGLTDECEMAFAIKKCAYAADPEVRVHRRILRTDAKTRVIFVKLEYLDVTVLRHGVGEVRVVVGRAPACWQVWRGMQYKEECFYNWTWDVCSHWKQTND